jgi:hypothetical protein
MSFGFLVQMSRTRESKFSRVDTIFRWKVTPYLSDLKFLNTKTKITWKLKVEWIANDKFEAYSMAGVKQKSSCCSHSRKFAFIFSVWFFSRKAGGVNGILCGQWNYINNCNRWTLFIFLNTFFDGVENFGKFHWIWKFSSVCKFQKNSFVFKFFLVVQMPEKF